MPTRAPTAILALETEIAKVQWNRADRRDEDKIYNPMPIADLKTLAPRFPLGRLPRGSRHSADRPPNGER